MCDGIEIPRITVTVAFRDDNQTDTSSFTINDLGEVTPKQAYITTHADEAMFLAHLAGHVREFAAHNIQDWTHE